MVPIPTHRMGTSAEVASAVPIWLQMTLPMSPDGPFT